MASILKSLRLAADPNRLRVLLLLEQEELSVAELQEILSKGQSQISTHLSQLKQAGLVDDRRMGKNAFYRLTASAELMELFRQAAVEVPEAAQDQEALRLALRKRRDNMRRYFDELAGKFGRQYVPGRSWKGIAEALLKLMPPMVIADLGAGEGTISQLMAQRAKRVIAIDNSEKMVEFGAELARKHDIANLEYRLGDLEDVPITQRHGGPGVSQSGAAPRGPPGAGDRRGVADPEARRPDRDPGSLSRHHFEEAREMYADLWLGFTELEIERYMKSAGFKNVETAVVYRETGSSLLRDDAGDGGEVAWDRPPGLRSVLSAYLLYPIIRRKPRRFSASSAPSTPAGHDPSITPSTPRPCSLSATTTCTGFAVAQKMPQTSGTSLIRPSTLIGYPSVITTTNMWPAATALAFFAASAFSASSLPSTRVRQGPDASLNATPNFICGTVFTIAS